MSSIRWVGCARSPTRVWWCGATGRRPRCGSVLKCPGEAVARVDMSLCRLQFTAEQGTREKIGVGPAGRAACRAVRPELAKQTLDLRDPEALARVLSDARSAGAQ